MGTYGMMATDHEIRCDYDKLRKDRLEKTRKQMKKDGIGSMLVFEQDNIRYITATKLGEWNFNIRQRYVLLCEGQEPILFETGSAIPTKQKLSPWIKDIRPLKGDMKGIMDPGAGNIQRGVDEIYDIIKGFGLQDAPLGIDCSFLPWIRGLEAHGLEVIDGQQCMLNAQAVKTPEEIYLLEMSAAAVDAGYYRVMEFARPGVRENEIAAVMRSTLLELGAECVHNVNVITGNRAYPHPHDMSDRILRPGDMIFLDVVNDFMGYKTCYYRTMVCGEPTKDQIRIYNKAYDWIQKAMSVVKPGVSTAKVAEQFPTAKEFGYDNEEDAFLLQLAHGIGISHWAKPAIMRGYSFDYPETIQEGMVIAFETYYGEGQNAARIEEELVVTADGYDIITKFPCSELISCW